MRVEETTVADLAAGAAKRAHRLLSFEQLVVRRTDDLATQALRSIIVGAAATLLDMCALYLLVRSVGLHYSVAAAISFVVGVGLGYVLSVRWVFASRALSSPVLEFSIFVLINVVGLGATEVILFVFVERLHLHFMIGKLCAIVALFGWNFGLRRALLFRSGHRGHDSKHIPDDSVSDKVGN